MNLTSKGKKDNHHFLNLEEGTTFLQALLQVYYLWVWKSFTSQPSEELSPPQAELTPKRNQMVKYCCAFLAGDICERTQFPASYKAALGKWREDQGLRHSRKKKSCWRASGRKKMFWVCAKMQWIIVQICESFHVDPCKAELLCCHYQCALCITEVSQICSSVHVVRSPQLNSWAILATHGWSIFSLKQVWDHSSKYFCHGEPNSVILSFLSHRPRTQ